MAIQSASALTSSPSERVGSIIANLRARKAAALEGFDNVIAFPGQSHTLPDALAETATATPSALPGHALEAALAVAGPMAALLKTAEEIASKPSPRFDVAHAETVALTAIPAPKQNELEKA